MKQKLGVPRANPTEDCKPITNPTLKQKMVLKRVHDNFRVTGHVLAVERLSRIFEKVRIEKPDLYPVIGTLCCRLQRNSQTEFSNHSWGTAIDLTIEGRLDAVGDGLCQRGLLDLYPYFHAEGFYWGAEFNGRREDAMHFEIATETLSQGF